MEKGYIGITQQAKRIFWTNFVTFLLCLAMLIANVVMYCLNVQDKNAEDAIKIANVVISSLVLVTMAGTLALSATLKKTLKMNDIKATGMTVLLWLTWIMTAFFLVMFIISNVSYVVNIGGNETAWSVCAIICQCLPISTFVFGCILYSSAKNIKN